MKRMIMDTSSNKEEVVRYDELNFCPFCSCNHLYTYEPTRGFMSCPRCDAIFKVVEHPDSTRFFEE